MLTYERKTNNRGMGEAESFWKKAEIIGNIHWDLVNILGVSLDIIDMTPQEWDKGSTPIFKFSKNTGSAYIPFDVAITCKP